MLHDDEKGWASFSDVTQLYVFICFFASPPIEDSNEKEINMSMKQAYVEKIQARLNEWDAEIEKLKPAQTKLGRMPRSSIKSRLRAFAKSSMRRKPNLMN